MANLIFEDSIPFIQSLALAASILAGGGFAYFIAAYLKND